MRRRAGLIDSAAGAIIFVGSSGKIDEARFRRAVATTPLAARTTATGEAKMRTHHYGQKLKLPSTFAIKHQLRKLMAEEASEKARAEAAENPGPDGDERDTSHS
jgi:hypothetical protein